MEYIFAFNYIVSWSFPVGFQKSDPTKLLCRHFCFLYDCFRTKKLALRQEIRHQQGTYFCRKNLSWWRWVSVCLWLLTLTWISQNALQVSRRVRHTLLPAWCFQTVRSKRVSRPNKEHGIWKYGYWHRQFRNRNIKHQSHQLPQIPFEIFSDRLTTAAASRWHDKQYITSSGDDKQTTVSASLMPLQSLIPWHFHCALDSRSA